MAWDATKPDLDPLTGTDFDDADGHFRDNYEWLELALAEFCNFPGSLDYLDEMGAPKGRRYNAAGRAGLTPVEGMWILRSDRKCLDNYRSTSWHAYHMAIVGEMTLAAFSPASPPDGWLACDGSEISRTTYADLFSAIGTAWGVGDGSTTFNLPNAKGRVLVGMDDGDADYNAVGSAKSGGASTHQLAADEIASHSHPLGTNDGQHHHKIDGGPNAGALTTAWRMYASGGSWYDRVHGLSGSHNHTVDDSGESRDQAHENKQPYLVLGYLIYAGV